MEARFNVVSVAVATGNLDIAKTGNFKDFGLSEEHVEKLLASGVMLKGDIKIVGRQVPTEYGWKADLVGLRRNGEIVVVEVKRDQADMRARKEPCEIQAIRYAAGLMEIRTIEDIVNTMYFPFSADRADITETDAAIRREILAAEISDYLHPRAAINQDQELMLVASGFDAGTISACHWLHQHGLTIACVQVSPFQNEEGKLLLVVDRVFPLESLQELKSRTRTKQGRAEENGTRAQFPSTHDMLDDGLIKKGQTVYLKGTQATAVIVDGDLVQADGAVMRWNEWAKKHKSGSFSLYRVVSVDSAKGKTLHELRLQESPSD